MITGDQIWCHLVGDYVIQSDWMAQRKTSSSVAAAVHAVSYTMPFALVSRSLLALIAIAATHFAIDRWRLARYVVWAKNRLAPRHAWGPSFADCAGTGYPPDRPPWMAVWLLIIADNTMHLACNALAMWMWP